MPTHDRPEKGGFFSPSFSAGREVECHRMAILDSKTLLKLPVHAKSGALLGKVAGFDFDVETHGILRYRVQPKGLASGMLASPLLVAREQVLSIDAEKMVVDDAVEKEMELAKAKAIGLISEARA